MADLEVHLLDPGSIEYGDCVLCLVDQKAILIDGGKKASARETRDTVLGRDVIHRPIQQQIESLHGSTDIDLLIITHCHSDHIGSLPALIENGVINCEWALIADPQLGYGIGGDSEPFPPVDQMSPADKLWLALREEPFHSTSDAAVLEFIEDSAREYHDYADLAVFLKRKLGARCVRYKGLSSADSVGLEALLAEFEGTGLTILGPSIKQLGNCAKFLVGRSGDMVGILDELTKDGSVDLAAAYRRELGFALSAAKEADRPQPHIETSFRRMSPVEQAIEAGKQAYREAIGAQDDPAEAPIETLAGEDAEDTPENGNAVNNQSLVLSIGHGASRALLTGDMQLAQPQLSDDGVKQEMKALRGKIADDVGQNGRFGFIKLSHHGANNGHSLKLLREWGSGLFGISTGSASSKHPTAATLAALEALHNESSDVRWGRTDLNGCISYKVAGDRRVLLKERGRWNDTTAAAQRAGDAVPSEPPPSVTLAPTRPEITPTVQMSDGNIEVTVRYPFGKGKVRITIDSEPEGSSVPLP